jgi:hypothetical protein
MLSGRRFRPLIVVVCSLVIPVIRRIASLVVTHRNFSYWVLGVVLVELRV